LPNWIALPIALVVFVPFAIVWLVTLFISYFAMWALPVFSLVFVAWLSEMLWTKLVRLDGFEYGSYAAGIAVGITGSWIWQRFKKS
jgi:hypothetical protein